MAVISGSRQASCRLQISENPPHFIELLADSFEVRTPPLSFDDISWPPPQTMEFEIRASKDFHLSEIVESEEGATMIALALAVLNGDMDAALALADAVQESHRAGCEVRASPS